MIEKELSIGWTLREVKAGLEVYNRGQLDRHIKPYTKAFLAGEKKWLLKQESRIAKATDMALVVAKTKQTTKAAALTYNAVPFLHPDCFKRFVKYLPKDAQAILEHVVLSGPIGHREVEERFGVIGSIQATKKDWRGVYPRLESPEFQFYMSNDPYSYYSFSDDDIIYTLPATVRLLISPLLFPEPFHVSEFAPQPDRIEEKTLLGEAIIQEELPGLLIRLQQKPLRLTKKGRPSIATIRSIGKKLKIREFYPNTDEADLKLIRVSSLVGLLSLSNKLDTPDIIKLIKDLFDYEFTQGFHLPIHLLNYIKGVSRLDTYRMMNCGPVYKDIVRSMPAGRWILYEDLEKSLKIQQFDAFPIDGNGMYELRVEVPELVSRYAETKSVRVYPNRSEKLVLWPAFRAAMFMMASWGVIDIIYEEPDLSIISETADSPYDGIKAIRLNDLGAFVLGVTQTYKSKIKAPFELELAEDSLSILLTDGDLDRAAMAIASFAKPFGSKRFYTDSKLFLGDCKNPLDLEHKIRIFKTIFSDELPANWKLFFDEISQKVNPLEEENDFAVFRVDQDNRNLLQLIARDPELKRLCLKAEGFLILIAKKDINKFRKRLQTFGYLLE